MRREYDTLPKYISFHVDEDVGIRFGVTTVKSLSQLDNDC